MRSPSSSARLISAPRIDKDRPDYTVYCRGWDSRPHLLDPRHPGLRMRPQAPNKGRGRIQVAVRRAFLAAGSDELTTSQVYDYALPRVRADLWRQMQRCSVLRVLDQLCHRVGRDRAHGAIIWKLKEPLE